MELSKEQEASLNQLLEKAGAYEQMVNAKGWEWLKKYAETKIQSFANEAILSGYKSLEEYNLARGKVLGIRELLSEVTSALDHLEKYREENK